MKPSAIVASSVTPVAAASQPAAEPVWQQAMKDAVRDPYELCRLLGLPASLAEKALRGETNFPLFVPRGYLARMRPGDPDDPLLRQVLPRSDEDRPAPGFEDDPVADGHAAWGATLLRKYHGRVLMVAAGACPVHCRYCFRRHFPYGQVPKSDAAWDEACRQIAADSSLEEVILSGGDPLSVVDDRLARLARSLAAVGHLRRLRIHSRFPIMIPERVTDALLAWLTGTRLTPIVVIHANHAAELDANVAHALGRLAGAGVMLLNQAVLLRGVNDNLPALMALSERLIDLRVVPYYLHQLDRVAGAAHFEVPPDDGMRLIASLRGRLPGYAVPRYVREVPGQVSKVVLA
jgi:EF-P beta-lysylation protein EpmB